MEKVNTVVLELEEETNQLNNEEFINICSLFYEKLQLVDDKIVNKILNHEANKVILQKLYNLSKLNGNYIFYKYIYIYEFNKGIIYNFLDSIYPYQEFSYDSLTKEQKLSLKAINALLNTCLYKG